MSRSGAGTLMKHLDRILWDDSHLKVPGTESSHRVRPGGNSRTGPRDLARYSVCWDVPLGPPSPPNLGSDGVLGHAQ